MQHRTLIKQYFSPESWPRITAQPWMRAGAGEYTLSDLQAYLGQFPAAHYSHGGREPLLYCTVLLLSLQFRAAVAFLAQDASARDYRIDAPHLAIALTAHQVHVLSVLCCAWQESAMT